VGGNGERWMAGWEGKGRGRGQMGIGHALGYGRLVEPIDLASLPALHQRVIKCHF